MNAASIGQKATADMMMTGALRVAGWSALAMGVTAGVGALIGSR